MLAWGNCCDAGAAKPRLDLLARWQAARQRDIEGRPRDPEADSRMADAPVAVTRHLR